MRPVDRTAGRALGPRNAYTLGMAVAVGTALVLVLSAGALGIVGDGGRADRPYVAVPAVLVLGAALVRLRARGMAMVLAVTAAVHGVATVAALAVAPEGVDPSVVDVVGLAVGFMALFGAAAWLFHRAAASGSTGAA